MSFFTVSWWAVEPEIISYEPYWEPDLTTYHMVYKTSELSSYSYELPQLIIGNSSLSLPVDFDF